MNNFDNTPNDKEHEKNGLNMEDSHQNLSDIKKEIKADLRKNPVPLTVLVAGFVRLLCECYQACEHRQESTNHQDKKEQLNIIERSGLDSLSGKNIDSKDTVVVTVKKLRETLDDPSQTSKSK
jgi:hypothetical protein